MINVIFYAIQLDSLVSQLLVAGIPTPLNMSSSMGRMTSHIWWKMFNMFETTNHIIYRSFSQEIVTYGDLQLRASGSEPLWGFPKWMVYKGKSWKIGDFGLPPWLRKPPNIIAGHQPQICGKWGSSWNKPPTLTRSSLLRKYSQWLSSTCMNHWYLL